MTIDLTNIAQNQEEAEFLELVKAHDVTYAYSDDGKVYARGRQQSENIRLKASLMPQERAKAIWNAVMESKFGAHADMFKWT